MAQFPPLSSATSIQARFASHPTARRMWPWSGVYLTALWSKLPRTCSSLTGSPRHRHGPSPSKRRAWCLAAVPPVDYRRQHLPADVHEIDLDGTEVILPRMTRDTSSRSSTIRVRLWVCRPNTCAVVATSSSRRHRAEPRRCGSAKRVAQLVAEHGEELVLASVVLGKPFEQGLHLVLPPSRPQRHAHCARHRPNAGGTFEERDVSRLAQGRERRARAALAREDDDGQIPTRAAGRPHAHESRPRRSPREPRRPPRRRPADPEGPP